MLRRNGALFALAFLLYGAAPAAEAPGIAVGTAAPAIEGKTWVSQDGKAPELKGKVHLIDFWFAE